MMKKPVWFDYLVWDYSDESFPVAKGLRKDTPTSVIEEYKKDTKEFKNEQEENPDVRFV